MSVIEQKTTNKNKVDFDLNRLDKSKTTIFSKYLENLHELRAIWLSGNPVVDTSALEVSGRTEALHLEWE